MPRFEVTSPEGKRYEISAPDGASQDQVLSYAQEQFGKAKAPPEKAATASVGDRIARQAGLGVRGAVEGASALPLLAGDALNELYNLAVSGVEKVTGTNLPKLGKASEYVGSLLTKAGLPVPSGTAEEVANSTIKGMYGAVPFAKAGQVIKDAASPVAQKIGQVLSSGQGTQVVSGATGALASETARQNDAGPVGELVSGVVGAAIPALAPAAAAAAVRGAARGGEAGRQRMADRTQTFRDAGAENVSVGQASGNRAIQATESGLSRTPGSAGVMVRTGEKQSADMGARVESISDSLSPNASAAKAGAVIEGGIKSFVKRFRAEQGSLYSKLDQHIQPDTRVNVQNVLGKLDELTQPIAGADALSGGALGKPAVDILKKQFLDDVVDGTLPYEAVKQLRTRVGEKLSTSSLTDDIDRATWKRIYGALSDDMAQAARDTGPVAERAFNRANDFTRAGHGRIDTYLDRVSGKDTVEKIFQATVNPSELREGASTVNAVMRSLTPAERPAVQAAFIKRMGLATPGNQNEFGEVFSAQTFLTNWNKISPEAKMTLFAGSKGNELRQNLDKIAEASNMIREGSKVFANPSGTSQAISNQAVGVGLAAGVVTGQFPAVGMILGGMAGANISARVLTNQNVVRWLAESTTVNPGAIPAQVNTLVQIAQKEDKETRRDIGRYVRAVSQELAQQRQQQAPPRTGLPAETPQTISGP